MLKIIKTHRGAAMIETIIAFPVLLMLGLGIVHVGLIFQAKSNLEYAALMAARYAASEPGGFDVREMENIIWYRMRGSRYRPEETITDLDRDGISIQVLGPSTDMFRDFCINAALDGGVGDCPMVDCIIPNDNLINRSTAAGGRSNVSIQDANILRLEVSYGLDTKVPFMKPFFISSPGNDALSSTTQITAVAIVRMQVPARAQAGAVPPIECLFNGTGC